MSQHCTGAPSDAILVHGITGPRGSALAAWLERGPQQHGSFWPLAGPDRRIVHGVSGPPALVAELADGLPAGAARAEAVVARARRRGLAVARGEPAEVAGAAALLALCRERGRSSVELLRRDPGLVTGLQAGSWFNAAWRARTIRRVLCRAPRRLLALVAASGPDLAKRSAADAAFWGGVREAATPREWQRLTRSSYSVLLYHRLAGEGKPGQERLDLPPGAFRRQMRLLTWLGFHPLTPAELRRFHASPDACLSPRSYVLTLDDGFADNLAPLRAQVGRRPHLFIPTAAIGGRASWMDGEPLLDWAQVRELAASGVVVGSHTRRHARLPGLARDVLEDEVRGSREDVDARLGGGDPPWLAYPHGVHDEAARAAAIATGYAGAFTTDTGRNGAGTDPFCLRRISPQAGDGALLFLLQVLTGELPPRAWPRAPFTRRSAGRR